MGLFVDFSFCSELFVEVPERVLEAWGRAKAAPRGCGILRAPERDHLSLSLKVEFPQELIFEAIDREARKVPRDYQLESNGFS